MCRFGPFGPDVTSDSAISDGLTAENKSSVAPELNNLPRLPSRAPRFAFLGSIAQRIMLLR